MLDKALEPIGYDRFLREEQPTRARGGPRVGLGIVCYVEGTGIGPYEGAKVQVQSSGKVTLATGIGTQGQGHFTAFAQIVADQLGVAIARRRGDHRRHRPVLLGRRHLRQPRRGGRRQRRARRGGAVRQKILKTAAEHFECAEDDLVIADGKVLDRRRAASTVDHARRAGAAGEPAARRGGARHRAGPGGDALFRPGKRRHGQRRARDDRRDRRGRRWSRRSCATSSCTTAAP